MSTSVIPSRPGWSRTSNLFVWQSPGEKTVEHNQQFLMWCIWSWLTWILLKILKSLFWLLRNSSARSSFRGSLKSPKLAYIKLQPLKNQRSKDSLNMIYPRRNVSGMARRHRFFLLVHMRKSFVYCHFYFNFSAPNKCSFFLNQSFLGIHVNKVSHYNMAHSQFTI